MSLGIEVLLSHSVVNFPTILLLPPYQSYLLIPDIIVNMNVRSVAVSEFATKLLTMLERPPVDSTGFYPGRLHFASR